MSRIRENFLNENKGNTIRIIFWNGYQMRGKLVDYDHQYLLINSVKYADPEVVSLAAITTLSNVLYDD